MSGALTSKCVALKQISVIEQVCTEAIAYLAPDTACDACVDVGIDNPKRKVWPLANAKRVAASSIALRPVSDIFIASNLKT
jgi:hypothetical protein